MYRFKLMGSVLVLLMKKDGSTEVFVSVESLAQQHQQLNQQEVQP